MANGLGGIAAAAGGFAESRQRSRLFELQQQQLQGQQDVARGRLALAQRQQTGQEGFRAQQLGIQQGALDFRKQEAERKLTGEKQRTEAIGLFQDSTNALAAIKLYQDAVSMEPGSPEQGIAIQAANTAVAGAFSDEENQFGIELTAKGIPLLKVTNVESEEGQVFNLEQIKSMFNQLDTQRRSALTVMLDKGDITFDQFRRELGIADPAGAKVLSASASRGLVILQNPDGSIEVRDVSGGVDPVSTNLEGGNLVVRNKRTGEITVTPIPPNPVGRIVTETLRVRGASKTIKKIIRQDPDGNLFLETIPETGAAGGAGGDAGQTVEDITRGL